MLRRLLIASIAISLSALSSLTLAQSMSSSSEERATPYSERSDVRNFIRDVARRRKLDEDWIASVLDRARYQPKIERLMTPRRSPPGVRDARKDWERYRAIFIESYRINLGARFWQKNKVWLDKAKQIYRVDPAVIIGIIGVETRYGENTGSWRVLDSLVTLSFDYKRRAEFFRKELEDFLVMVHRYNLKPLEVLGSYAGAVGLPQFMPSSIARYGVDFDGDGKVDLNSSIPDTIGSVANYLSKCGWVLGLPMVIEADITTEENRKFGSGTNPRFTWRLLQAGGVKPLPTLPSHPDSMPAWIVDFPYYKSDALDVDKLYRVGTRNFTAVLRYNSSYFYAGAVCELGSAIAKKVGEPGLLEGSVILPSRITAKVQPQEEVVPTTSETTTQEITTTELPSNATPVEQNQVVPAAERNEIIPIEQPSPAATIPLEQNTEAPAVPRILKEIQPDVIIEKVTPLP